MMMSSADGASGFNLKAPQYYFDDTKNLVLLQSALAGDFNKAKELVAEGANPNAEGPIANPYNHLRLLHYAIAAKSTHAVRVLVAVGADPEVNTQGGAGPAFLFAINQDNLEMLSLLLDLRPISTLSRDTLEDLLFESVVMSRSRCLELLLKRGAPIDFPDKAGYTIMLRSIDAQNYELAEYLLVCGIRSMPTGIPL